MTDVVRAAGRLLRRLPFTTTMVLLSLLAGLVTTTLWTELIHKSWYHRVAFGLPSLQDGHWWSPITGSFLAFVPIQYVAIVGTTAIFCGISEWVIGTRKTAIVALVGQFVSIVAVSLLLVVLRHTSWGWAQARASEYDVGFSAGAFACLSVASAAMRSPWRQRVRLVMFAYVLPNLLIFGTLADLEHAVALLIWLPLGPRIVGRRAVVRRPAVTRLEARWIIAVFFWLSAVVTLLGQYVSARGPFGHFGGGGGGWSSWLAAVVDVAIGVGLLRGRRSWWRVAVALTALGAVLDGFVVVVLAWAREIPDGYGLAVLVLAFDVLQLVVLLRWRRAFRNPSARRRAKEGASAIGGTPTEEDRTEARKRLMAVGSPNHLSWMTTWPENRWWFPADHDGYVCYQLRSRTALALCDPVAATAQERRALTDAFTDAAITAGTTPCLFSVTEEVADWARGRGWIPLQVAEEAIIDLPTLEFRGKKWQDIRTALNQGAKQGITYRHLRLADAPRGIVVQVRAISDQWVGDKGMPEMGFTLGGIDEAMDPEVVVGLAVDADGTVHGVTSWMPVFGDGGTHQGWTLDVMRCADQSFRYTMEFLIASACVQFKEDGYAFVSLSGAPLAHAAPEDDSVDLSGIEQVLNTIGTVLEPYYGFQSLENFKKKFQPRYRRLYMVFPDEGALPKIGVALSSAYLDGLGPAKLIALARH